MSDTPETDNAAFAACEVYEDCGVVYAEFAEQLERERDEARELAANLEISLTAVIRSANVRQDETEHAMAKRDKAEKQASESINQVGKMLLRNVKLKVANDEIRSGFLCLVADLQDTIARLRNEINFTIRLSRTWEDDVKKITADRDYWKAEAERWQEVAK